ncbi:MAG: hypothetical protein ACF8R7_17800 [Phycisphaerales bacterium JB039]
MRSVGFGAISAMVVAALAGGASGQILLDGDMEALALGTAPDCGAPAGAWIYPDAYATAGLCEALPEDTRIEPGPTGGNSLLMKIDGAALNIHLTNLFTETIMEGAGIAVVQFDLFVTGGFGGAAVYVGGDHGGGGFSNTTDRGPQILWTAAGQINGYQPAAEAITDYKQETWQRVVLEIDLVADTFDMYHTNDITVDPVLVTSGFGFRSGTQNFLDRFTFAHFGGAEPINVAFLDNVSVTVEAVGCYADCDGTGVLDFFDFLCFQNAFATGDPYADCDGTGVLDFFDFLCFQNEFAMGCP